MTKEEYRKRLPFIEAWLDGTRIGILTTDNEIVKSIDEPFKINPTEQRTGHKFIVLDKYCDLRLGVLSGKTLLISNEEHCWEEVDCDQVCIRHWDFNNKPLEDFKFKVDTWVSKGVYARHKVSGKVIKCNHQLYNDSMWYGAIECIWLKLEEFTELYEQWFPIKGELCFMWNNLGGLPAIRKYDYTNTKGMFFDTQQKRFRNCIPYLGDEFWINKSN